MNAVTEVMDELRKALSEVDDIRASLRRKVRHCDELIEERDQMERERDEARERNTDLRKMLEQVTRERDEARAEVERLREMAHDFEAMREDRDAAIARITEVGVMVATNGNALAKEAYRRGAEAMREACIGYAHKIGFHGLTVDIRALPIPEEP